MRILFIVAAIILAYYGCKEVAQFINKIKNRNKHIDDYE